MTTDSSELSMGRVKMDTVIFLMFDLDDELIISQLLFVHLKKQDHEKVFKPLLQAI